MTEAPGRTAKRPTATARAAAGRFRSAFVGVGVILPSALVACRASCPRARPTEAARHNRFAGHHPIEAREQLSRFFLHRWPEHRSQFIHLPLDALRVEDRFAKLLHPRQIKALEPFHLEHALQEEDLPAPGPEDAQMLQLISAAGYWELPK